MRHGKKILKIGRNASHRKATLQSMSAALLEHKRITTTFGKAKALRRFVEPILTHAKDDSTHSRRQAFRKLNDKEAVKTLYNEVAGLIGDRPGGYTRIVKLGQRGGDAAEMAIVELVDFNDVKPEGASGTKRKTRRSRRRGNNTAPTIKEPAAETLAPAEAEAAAETVTAAAEETSQPPTPRPTPRPPRRRRAKRPRPSPPTPPTRTRRATRRSPCRASTRIIRTPSRGPRPAPASRRRRRSPRTRAGAASTGASARAAAGYGASSDAGRGPALSVPPRWRRPPAGGGVTSRPPRGSLHRLAP